jgi:hypothetical protein
VPCTYVDDALNLADFGIDLDSYRAHHFICARSLLFISYRRYTCLVLYCGLRIRLSHSRSRDNYPVRGMNSMNRTPNTDLGIARPQASDLGKCASRQRFAYGRSPRKEQLCQSPSRHPLFTGNTFSTSTVRRLVPLVEQRSMGSQRLTTVLRGHVLNQKGSGRI